MADADGEARRRAGNAWALLGGLQALMATVIGGWMIVNGRGLAGAALLLVAALIVAGVRWKRARLRNGG